MWAHSSHTWRMRNPCSCPPLPHLENRQTGNIEHSEEEDRVHTQHLDGPACKTAKYLIACSQRSAFTGGHSRPPDRCESTVETATGSACLPPCEHGRSCIGGRMPAWARLRAVGCATSHAGHLQSGPGISYHTKGKERFLKHHAHHTPSTTMNISRPTIAYSMPTKNV